MGLASRFPDRFRLTAAADPNTERRNIIRDLSGNPDFQCFETDLDLLSRPGLADVLIIGTQDSYHFIPCLEALRKGYDILLEKPISPDPAEVRTLQLEAARLGRRVMVCHVLRYTPFYETVKEILTSGRIGKPVAFHLTEGVGLFHYAHSYVRGHWANRDSSSPMILAKSCHDMDILSWLADQPCRSVASYGGLFEFKPEPKAQEAGNRCSETCGCPPAVNALNYLNPNPFLEQVMEGAENASEADIRNWLRSSPWGRCVNACDNNVVDRQVVAFSFDQGIQATFTMTAFDEGRNLEIFGTEGSLRGGDFLKRNFGCDLVLEPHHGGQPEKITIQQYEGQHGGHMGGDEGLIGRLRGEMLDVDRADMRSGIDRSVESHFMAFAADRARMEHRVVEMKELYQETESAILPV
jgi:predicted dehydrogenase